jgi:hypothetical protein
MGANSPFKNPNPLEVEIEVAVVTVAVVKTTAEVGVEIAAEVISWRGLLSMDMRTSQPHLVSLLMSVSTFAISAVFSKVAASNMITLPSTNGVWVSVPMYLNSKVSSYSRVLSSRANTFAGHLSVYVKPMN